MTFTINFLDDSTRPRAPKIENVTSEQRRHGQRLAAIHAMHLRQMSEVRRILEEVAEGVRPVADVTTSLNSFAMTQNIRRAGTICGEECQMLPFHHTAEDQWIFPALTGHDAGLTRVVERLAEEHRIIHALIERLEAVVKSHFGYEQEELEEALGFYEVDL